MLHIILLILKTIGIILISILGILLLLALIVLFTPIRYTIVAEKYDKIQLKIKVNWILSILYFKFTYEDYKFIYQFRIFGYLFRGSNKVKKIKKNRNRKNNKKQNNKNRNKKVGNSKHKKVGNNKHKKEENNYIQDDFKEGQGIQKYEAKQISNTKNLTDDNKSKENSKNVHCVREDTWEVYEKVLLLEDKKKTFLERIYNRIRSFFNKIKSFFIKLKTLKKRKIINIQSIFYNIKNTIHKITFIKSFLKDENNKKGLKKIWWSIRRITKHIFPNKIRANIRFGTGDPCLTGQLLGIVSLTYHLYKDVKVIPEFNNVVLEGNFYAKGRIRLFTLLIICIKIIIDKNFRYLIKSFNKLKEEL